MIVARSPSRPDRTYSVEAPTSGGSSRRVKAVQEHFRGLLINPLHVNALDAAEGALPLFWDVRPAWSREGGSFGVLIPRAHARVGILAPSNVLLPTGYAESAVTVARMGGPH